MKNFILLILLFFVVGNAQAISFYCSGIEGSDPRSEGKSKSYSLDLDLDKGTAEFKGSLYVVNSNDPKKNLTIKKSEIVLGDRSAMPLNFADVDRENLKFRLFSSSPSFGYYSSVTGKCKIVEKKEVKKAF